MILFWNWIASALKFIGFYLKRHFHLCMRKFGCFLDLFLHQFSSWLLPTTIWQKMNEQIGALKRFTAISSPTTYFHGSPCCLFFSFVWYFSCYFSWYVNWWFFNSTFTLADLGWNYQQPWIIELHLLCGLRACQGEEQRSRQYIVTLFNLICPWYSDSVEETEINAAVNVQTLWYSACVSQEGNPSLTCHSRLLSSCVFSCEVCSW